MDGGVAILTRSNPSRRNALSGTMRDGIAAAVQGLRADPEALVLTGAGDTIYAGGDIANMGCGSGARDNRASMQDHDRMWTALAAFDRPVIAAVDGWPIPRVSAWCWRPTSL